MPDYDPTIANRKVPRSYNVQLALGDYLEGYEAEVRVCMREDTDKTYKGAMGDYYIKVVCPRARWVGAISAIKKAFRRQSETFGERKARREFNKLWERGECWACGRIVGDDYLEKGHIVDRVCGGDDLYSNLAPMCIACNRALKDLHETREEAEIWRDTIRTLVEQRGES